MSRSLETLSLAIDGGGTRCRFALTHADVAKNSTGKLAGKSLVTIEGKSANVSSDFEGARDEILAGFSCIAQAARIPLEDLHAIPAYAGLAGVTGKAIATRLADALPMHNIRIEDDRGPALRGALGGDDGVLLHCGTGSFAAAQFSGQSRIAGGWGPVLGDQVSALWVGRRALTLTLDSVDGFAPVTALSEQLLARFGGTAEIVAFAGSAQPVAVAALAQDVTAQAAEGDPLAKRILNEVAADLAVLAAKMGWSSGVPLCLTGGIAPQYTRYLPAEMQADLIAPKAAPLEGAIALADDFRKELADERR